MPMEARLSVLPHEAMLMNSLRRLLTEVPQCELRLSTWASGNAEAQAAAPQHPPSPAHGESQLRDGHLYLLLCSALGRSCISGACCCRTAFPNMHALSVRS